MEDLDVTRDSSAVAPSGDFSKQSTSSFPIFAIVGLTAGIVVVAAVIIYRRRKGTEAQVDTANVAEEDDPLNEEQQTA